MRSAAGGSRRNFVRALTSAQGVGVERRELRAQPAEHAAQQKRRTKPIPDEPPVTIATLPARDMAVGVVWGVVWKVRGRSGEDGAARRCMCVRPDGDHARQSVATRRPYYMYMYLGTYVLT